MHKVRIASIAVRNLRLEVLVQRTAIMIHCTAVGRHTQVGRKREGAFVARATRPSIVGALLHDVAHIVVQAVSVEKVVVVVTVGGSDGGGGAMRQFPTT